MTTIWNSIVKNIATYTNQAKSMSFSGFLLLEDGFYLLLEDGFKLVLEQSGSTSTSWSNVTKN